MSTLTPVEVDFIVQKEDFSRFLVLDDGTIIKAKIVVRKIFFSPEQTPEGYPSNVGLDTVNAIAAIVPPSARGSPSMDPFNPQVDKGIEMKFEEQEIKIQEYLTSNGFKITVKPIVTKIFRYQKYNMYGEPVYFATIQAITNIEKIKASAS